MVAPTTGPTSKWFEYTVLATAAQVAAQTLYNRFFKESSKQSAQDSKKEESFHPSKANAGNCSAWTGALTAVQKANGGEGLGTKSVTLAQSESFGSRLAKRLRPRLSFSAVPLLAAPFAISSGSGAANSAGSASAEAAGEGIFTKVYSAASGALGFTWNHLSLGTKVAGGIGVLGLAYLAYRYWKSSGVNITNTNTNTNSVHIHFSAEPDMKVSKKQDGKGNTFITIQHHNNEELAEIVKRAIERQMESKGARL